MVSRREMIGGTAVVTLTGFAGCLDELENGEDGGSVISSGPQPSVVDVEADQDLMGAIGGTVDIYVLVENSGDDGDVEVTVIIYDENGNTLERISETVYVESDESRRVDLTVESPSGADSFEVQADSA